MADLSCSRTNRKRSSFAMKHFQRKSLKIFDLHPPLRRLVSFVAGIIHVKSEMLSNRHTHTDTQTKYRNPRCACTPRVNNTVACIALAFFFLHVFVKASDCEGRDQWVHIHIHSSNPPFAHAHHKSCKRQLHQIGTVPAHYTSCCVL